MLLLMIGLCVINVKLLDHPEHITVGQYLLYMMCMHYMMCVCVCVCVCVCLFVCACVHACVCVIFTILSAHALYKHVHR